MTEIKKKKIRYTLTFVGEISVPSHFTDEDTKDVIARDYYERGFDIENVDGIKWEEV